MACDYTDRTATQRAHRERLLVDAFADALDQHGCSVQVHYHRPGGKAAPPCSGLRELVRALDAAGLIDDTRIGEHW